MSANRWAMGKEKKIKTTGVGAACPKVKVADPLYNIGQIIRIMQKAREENVKVLTFPELSISSYSCGDLFFQDKLIDSCGEALGILLEKTANIPIVTAVGIPLFAGGKTYNCAVIIYKGNPVCAVAKRYLPNTKEFYERRWFAPQNKYMPEEVALAGRVVPFGKNLVRMENEDIIIGAEICEDLWGVIPQSSAMALEGANIILNLSASNELAGKSIYRKELIKQQTAKCICAYSYASAGVFESSTDTVFSGHCIIACNGRIISEGERFKRENSFVSADIDICGLFSARRESLCFCESVKYRKNKKEYGIIDLE